MFNPEIIEIRSRKTGRGVGILSGVYINAPMGMYKVLGIVDRTEMKLDARGFEEQLTALSRGRLYARILSIKPGLVAVIEPEEVMTLEES